MSRGAPDDAGTTPATAPEPTAPTRRRTRWLLVLGLVVLSPVCAEYLSGYDTSTGNPVELVGGLLIFSPLYGAPALLIRELARRSGVRWPGIIALAAAFGILQAGVIDQSLFSLSYRNIDYWDSIVQPTLIEPLGFAAYTAMVFVGGHVIWSYCIPIALVERLHPPLAGRPWLRLPGLVLTAVLYLVAAGLVLYDHLQTENDHASPAQITGALAVVALLVAFAFTAGRRRAPVRNGAVPGPLVVGVLSLLAALGLDFAPPTWVGVALGLAVLAVAAVAVTRLSRSPRWGGQHVVALAAGALLARAVTGFLAVPLGDVAPVAKYAHNIVLLVGAVLLAAWAARRNQPAREVVRPA